MSMGMGMGDGILVAIPTVCTMASRSIMKIRTIHVEISILPQKSGQSLKMAMGLINISGSNSPENHAGGGSPRWTFVFHIDLQACLSSTRVNGYQSCRYEDFGTRALCRLGISAIWPTTMPVQRLLVP